MKPLTATLFRVVFSLLTMMLRRVVTVERRLTRIEKLDIIRMQAPDHEKYRFEGGEQ